MTVKGAVAVIVSLAAAALTLLFLASLRVSPGVADFHQVEINQLMAGWSGDDDVEFIELKMLNVLHNCQAGGVTSGEAFGYAPS